MIVKMITKDSILIGILALIVSLGACKDKSKSNTDELALLLATPDPIPQCDGIFDTALERSEKITDGLPQTVTAYEDDFCVFKFTSTQLATYTITATPIASVNVGLRAAYVNDTPFSSDLLYWEHSVDDNLEGISETLSGVSFNIDDSRYILVKVFHSTCGNGCTFTIDIN